MIGMLSLLIAAAAQTPSLTVKETRNVFDPDRLAAAHRLRVANGSEATLTARVEQAARVILLDATADCFDDAASATHRKPDCSNVGQWAERGLARLPSILPALVIQACQVEERAYATRFTVAEMDEVARFLGSETARKYDVEIDPINREATIRLRVLLSSTLAGRANAAAAEPSQDAP